METWENTIEFWNNMCKGTLLPECSTSTNYIFKVKFDFTPHTGIWWDNTMQNPGLFMMMMPFNCSYRNKN
jgi:hypothetical protein